MQRPLGLTRPRSYDSLLGLAPGGSYSARQEKPFLRGCISPAKGSRRTRRGSRVYIGSATGRNNDTDEDNVNQSTEGGRQVHENSREYVDSIGDWLATEVHDVHVDGGLGLPGCSAFSGSSHVQAQPVLKASLPCGEAPKLPEAETVHRFTSSVGGLTDRRSPTTFTPTSRLQRSHSDCALSSCQARPSDTEDLLENYPSFSATLPNTDGVHSIASFASPGGEDPVTTHCDEVKDTSLSDLCYKVASMTPVEEYPENMAAPSALVGAPCLDSNEVPEDVDCELLLEYAKTNEYYLSALAEYPDQPLLLSNYARFLAEIVEDIDASEFLFQRAVEVAPTDGSILAQYAKFAWEHRGNALLAGTMYERAIACSPEDCFILGAYAGFLWASDQPQSPTDFEPDNPIQAI